MGRDHRLRSFRPHIERVERRVVCTRYSEFTLAQARDYYLDVFAPTAEVAPEWSGDVAAGDPGALGAGYKQAILDRINQYRFMVGLPSVTIDAEFEGSVQAAALMMSVNNKLSHNPPADWRHWTSAGALGAGSANLALISGTDAIDAYMFDGGGNRVDVGHRRWVLRSEGSTAAIGDIPTPGPGFSRSNALTVSRGELTPGDLPSFVSWPPAGYLPYDRFPESWSFTPVRGLEVNSRTTVSLTLDGVPQPVTILNHGEGPAYGDGRALVWTVPRLTEAPVGERLFEVTVQWIYDGLDPITVKYLASVFDPTPTTIQAASWSQTALENAGFATVEIIRTGNLSGPSSIQFHTRDADAIAGVDYVATMGTLEFAPGESIKSIRIPLIDNSYKDIKTFRSFDVILHTPSRGTKMPSLSLSPFVWVVDDEFGQRDPQPRPPAKPPVDRQPPRVVSERRIVAGGRVFAIKLTLDEAIAPLIRGAVSVTKIQGLQLVRVGSVTKLTGKTLTIRLQSKVSTKSPLRIALKGIKDGAGNAMHREIWFF